MGPRTREVLLPPAQHRSTTLGRLTNLLLEGGGVIQPTGAGEGGLGVSILGLAFIPSSCDQLTLSPLQSFVALILRVLGFLCGRFRIPRIFGWVSYQPHLRSEAFNSLCLRLSSVPFALRDS